MRNFSILLISLLLVSINVNSQIIQTEPVFFTSDDSVRIIYNAAEGNKGLEGFSGDIWAHTGVITTLSTGPTDWKYVIAGWSENTNKAKLASLGNDLWELKISPDVRSYYNVPTGETITKLAFVFRNSDGSETGRMEDGSDIYSEVYEAGLNVSFIQPDKNFLLINPGETIPVQVASSGADSISLFQDSILIQTVNTNDINTEIIAENSGQHLIEVIAYCGVQAVNDSFSYFVKTEPVVEELPVGLKDGINYIDDNSVILVLFAPEKEFVFCIGDFNSWNIHEQYLMKRTPDSNRYWIQLTDLIPKQEYIFQYLIDGDIKIADPYTDKISDPWNDKYINSTTYPDLIAYPVGKTTETASVFQTAQEDFQWTVNNFNKPEKSNLIIYELLIRDFCNLHSFSCLTDTLNYLENLGVNAVELMPVSEFEGNESWGYNPSFYFAVDKYYGHKNNLKVFIDECHKRGIAVIIDMVLNHSYGQSPLVRMYWDAENNKPAANNPWYNQDSPNSIFSWGYDFNHESEATKTFIDRVNKYWINEFKVDGFRFDFTKGFTNTPGDGGSFDISRVNILKRMADEIWEEDSGSYIILEHFAINSEEKLLSDYGMMIWGNTNYNYGEAAMGYFEDNKSDFSWISYKKRGWNNANLVGYMESHDEERLLYKLSRWGNTQNPDYSLKDVSNSLARAELNANFFIPLPGPKMIWMFGELGYDYSIEHNGRVGNKPIRWDYIEVTERIKLCQVYSALNKLKQNYPVFQTDDFNINFSDTIKQIQLNHPELNINILGNFGIYQSVAETDFAHDGWWYDFWTGDSVEISNVNHSITMDPGQYLLYTDVRLDKPEIISGIKDYKSNKNNWEIKVYPNPVNDILNIHSSNKINIKEIRIYDLSGGLIKSKKINTAYSTEINIPVQGINPGIYILELTNINQIKERRKILIQ